MKQQVVGACLIATMLGACSSDTSDSLPVQAEPAGPGIIIVTTDSIRSRSQVLDAFVQQKQKRNYRVLVATEQDYGGESERGLARAKRIRQWLQGVYSDYEYLLLIGDGHPVYGDIPMVTVWPRHAMPADSCGGAFALDCRSCETDAMYADLTGNWDLNGNGRFGEHGLDDGPGGIDFAAELIVGRIPVYFDDVTEADAVLSHAIAYMNETNEQSSYRQRVLLPAATFYLPGERLAGYTNVQKNDGAFTAEWLKQNVLDAHNGLQITRLYEREGILPAEAASEGALSQEALVSEWSRGYGIVYWLGHGASRTVSRVVWNADDNGNGKADAREISAPAFITSESAAQIEPAGAAFVVAVSCEVGSADVPHNLAQSLLLQGAAVGMLGSSNVTPGDYTDYDDEQSRFDISAFGATNAGIEVVKGLLAGQSAAAAFAQARVTIGTSQSAEVYAGKMMLNYFGDPTLTLRSERSDIQW